MNEEVAGKLLSLSFSVLSSLSSGTAESWLLVSGSSLQGSAGALPGAAFLLWFSGDLGGATGASAFCSAAASGFAGDSL